MVEFPTMHIDCRNASCVSEGCPGVIEHCKQNEHCNFTDDNCASQFRDTDDLGNAVHPPSCCVCGNDQMQNWVANGTETMRASGKSKSRSYGEEI